MEPNSSVNIQEAIKAGRIVEARTLLTLHEGTLSVEKRNALDLELTRLHGEAEALIASADSRETEGKIEEAKVLYESVLLFAVDFPGIQSHINRVEESLLLAQAVKRRSRRIRQSIPIGQRVPQKKQAVPLRGISVAAGIIAVSLLLFFLRNQPLKTIPSKADQDNPVQIASVQPIPAPEKAAPPEPPETKVEKPAAVEPLSPPERKEEPATASIPVQPIETSPQITEQPPNQSTKQNKDELYTVQPGDSLSLIATRQFCSQDAWKEIHQLNREHITNPKKLQPGMVLQLKGIQSRCRSVQ